MTPVVIDTDPGIDDALALLLAWGSPELDIRAITTVAGNVPVAVATRNVLRLAALRRPSAVAPVAVGAAGPLARPLVTAVDYHGQDGLGDLPDWPPVEEPPGPGAVDAILQAARRDAGRLVLVALGPLTNVALALAADRRAMDGLRRLVVMGGAVDVAGNVTATAEFNAHVDPEAAARVLDSGLVPDLVPLDATRQVVLERGRLEEALARAPGPVATRIAAVTARGFRVDSGRGAGGLVLHDPLALGLAIDPTLCTWEAARLVVESDGALGRAAGVPNCRVARRVEAERFLALFLDRLCPRAS